ncbi:MAG: hypothetical protein GTO41_17420, partial [Burkholderiales bacterium]|nr:hypothetical protein [Burkholderiales bacterium]
MNRIKLGPLAKLSSPPPSSSQLNTETHVAHHSASEFEYSIFIPMHYERNYAYPLIVWLHSNTDDERQILQVMPQISTRNYAAICMRAPDRDPVQGYRWLQSLDSIDAAQNRIERAIDCARCRLNVDHAAIFIGGLGSGGTMAFRIAFRQPHWFAGVFSVNGRVPC